MELKEIIKDTDKIPGWFNPSQMVVLYPIIKDLDPHGLIVEIGTYHGRATRFFSLANPEIKIVTIDIVYNDVTYNPNRSIHPLHPPEGLFIDKKVLEEGNIFQVVGKSGEVAKGFNWKIDLLLIDDGHECEDVQRDTKVWSPSVKPEGYIVFHDYQTKHPGVVKAVNEWMKDNKEFTKVVSKNSLYVARKNKHA